ncbi:MAG: hypothetical protein QXU32_09925 [Nitrososphaerales archaeon]
MKRVSRGRCLACSQDFPVTLMSRHLQTCESISREGANHAKTFLIKVSANIPYYWLFIEIDSSSTLERLDAYLRSIWLECCGHLSCFTIGDKEYHSNTHSPFGERLNGMKVALDRLLSVGMSFNYEYDFGTTTALTLKVISSRPGRVKNTIHLLARNNAPTFKCRSCGSDATDVCSECYWEGDCTFCNKCLKKHKCGEEMALPVVNSPRMGLCAYVG